MSTFRWLSGAGRTFVAALLSVALLAVPAFASTSTEDDKLKGDVTVIVQKKPGAGTGLEQLVDRLGGEVAYDLSIINAFAATVPADKVAMLQANPETAAVTEDAPVQMHGLLGDLTSGLTDALAPKAEEEVTTGEANSSEVNPTPPEVVTEAPQPAESAPADESVYQDSINAGVAHAAGVTGEGSTVALIDTGVSNLPDLQDSLLDVRAPNGSTKKCVDLSGEQTCADTYGHGTFLAGLIAGNGAASGGKYAGVAPGADILSVKIAGRDGSASVGKILFAIQWVTQNKDRYGIDVMNLSLGTDSTQSYKYDPLNYAVERAWHEGVAVVVSAGNRGPGARTISKPADDPWVITAGAVDDLKTPGLEDDILPDFSSKGPTAADGITKPDITAPGAHVISLRAPGSAVEEKFPGGGVDSTYRRGSGTSQSAAIISGSVALLKAAHPDMTPNEVKFALKKSANRVASDDKNSVGAGMIDIGEAVATPPQGEANQNITRGNGTGSLKNSQGTVKLVAKNGRNILGVLGSVIPKKGDDSGDPSGGSWYGTSWYGGSWYGGSWYGGSWYGMPNGGSWYGGSWYGIPNGGSWYGGSWYGGSWYGGSWYGGSWYGGSWYGGSWYGAWD